jgi:uncharacterized membrane protein
MLQLAGDWAEFLAALVAFFASHAIPSYGGLRQRLIAGLGRRAYFTLYSLLSLLLLVWLIAAAARAPFVELWPFEPWQRHVPMLLVPVAVVLALLGLCRPNPLSLSLGPADAFDPEHPGIAGLVRHPVLWATLLWSLAHLVANGDLAHVVVFGLFAALSVLGMAALDARKRRQYGLSRWQELARRTALLPRLPLAGGWRPADLWLVGLGLVLAVLLALLHPFFAGVPALPV